MGRESGFTLIELMVTLAVAAILVGVALPNMRAFIQNNRIKTETSDLAAALGLARAEAAKRSIGVKLCSRASNSDPAANACSGTNWRSGWFVFVDANSNNTFDTGDTLLKSHFDLPSSLTLTVTDSDNVTLSNVKYGASGTITINKTVTFKVCDERSGAFGRNIIVEAVGRPTVPKENATCP